MHYRPKASRLWLLFDIRQHPIMKADVDAPVGDGSLYARQGFGARLVPSPPYALVIVDFVVGFADSQQFGGGNIPAAIEQTHGVLAQARKHGWPIAHTRIVLAEDGSDFNVFCRKVPALIRLTETAPSSQIVPEVRHGRANWPCAKPCRQASPIPRSKHGSRSAWFAA
jgi:hypothetical protein